MKKRAVKTVLHPKPKPAPKPQPKPKPVPKPHAKPKPHPKPIPKPQPKPKPKPKPGPKPHPKPAPWPKPVPHPHPQVGGSFIEHVVIIVKENHTFDNYFGSFPGVNGEVLPQAPDPIADPLHNHQAWLERKMPGGAVKLQYKQQDIPAYWALAQQYTLCDNYYTEIASQSEPNHLVLIAASSPLIDNYHPLHPGEHDQPSPPFQMPSLPAALETAGLDWRNYAEAHSSYFGHIAGLAGNASNVASAQFDMDVAKGYLPAVSWLYAPGGLSEHPPFAKRDGTLPGPYVKPGQQWTADRLKLLAASPLWATTAVFITWDDFGGWYDHVDPPNVAQWKNDGTSYAGTQFRYGDRVPCLVVSPYAKPGYVSKKFHSHVSPVRFCLNNFGLPPLGAWDAEKNSLSDDMADCFDYAQAPLGPPKFP